MDFRPKINIAHPDFRELWLSHPTVGDASFDSFQRSLQNPVFRGNPPYEWAVNGFLFEDPVSGDWYLFIGMYPRGYWKPGGCRLLRSETGGLTWEDLGIILQGAPDTFDGDGKTAGGTPDISVCYSEGRYHIVYDWANPDNSDGGLAYAVADHPEGPYYRHPEPLHRESRQPLILGQYKRIYGGTLFRRKNDWLILAAMSTPGNGGGTWALVALTAEQVTGSFAPPQMLIYPQSKVFHPSPVEFYPCFRHQEWIYVPATSLGHNRNFQVLYRAEVERAHLPEAWRLLRFGSCWHAEAQEHESSGLWGQTYSGFIDSHGVFRIMFPSKDSKDRGTINMAHRRWNTPYRSGFVLSAPNGPALTIFQRRFSAFSLRAEMRSNGMKSIVWNHNAPIGGDRIRHANGNPHPLTLSDCTQLTLDESGWQLRRIDDRGARENIAGNSEPGSRRMQPDSVEIQQQPDWLKIAVNSNLIWECKGESLSGSIGFFADAGIILHVDELTISTTGEECYKWLLPTDAIIGAGAAKDTWSPENADYYKFGFGYVSAMAGATLKWNYQGRGFRLWCPRAPIYGTYEIYINGLHSGIIDLKTPRIENSSPVFESPELPFAFQAVCLVRKNGTVPAGCLEILV
ncbi:hypothetical protein JXJ21_14995 [candidate division KSB1 bacterium]|nr:hypothetical protein [candidate division KSB1 bacterium]